MTEREITKAEAQVAFDKAWHDATKNGHAVRAVNLVITGDLGGERAGEDGWGCTAGWTFGSISHLWQGDKSSKDQLEGMLLAIAVYDLEPRSAWTTDIIAAQAEAKRG